LNTITSRSFRTLAAGAIFSALALSLPTVSSAQVGAKPPQVIVRFADLDISTSTGARALYRRIHSAAGNVCWRTYDSNELYMLNKDTCLQKVIADAVIKVNEPGLSAVFASKYGVSAPMVIAAAVTR